jgi:hypothetical protein
MVDTSDYKIEERCVASVGVHGRESGLSYGDIKAKYCRVVYVSFS